MIRTLARKFRRWRWAREQERRRVPFGIPMCNVGYGYPPPGRGYYADMPHLTPEMDEVTRLYALGRITDADAIIRSNLEGGPRA